MGLSVKSGWAGTLRPARFNFGRAAVGLALRVRGPAIRPTANVCPKVCPGWRCLNFSIHYQLFAIRIL